MPCAIDGLDRCRPKPGLTAVSCTPAHRAGKSPIPVRSPTTLRRFTTCCKRPATPGVSPSTLPFHQSAQFQVDAKNGTLPSYSFVEPSFTIEPNDQHSPHNVTDGERFLAEVWAAVSTGAHWAQTLLVITYDEHGGCYDHVPPP